jgi:hypothetical protein
LLWARLVGLVEERQKVGSSRSSRKAQYYGKNGRKAKREAACNVECPPDERQPNAYGAPACQRK